MHISLTQVGKRFGTHTALDGVSATIPAGSIVAVLGANGAGKATLLRLLATVQVPSSGEIAIDGELLSRERIDLRRRLMYLPEPPPLKLSDTPLGYMASMLAVYEVEPRAVGERVTAIYDELDLLPLAETEVATLSRGQAYKSALAALLAVDSELWLLDEPFAAGMDPQGAAVLKRHAHKASAQGKTIIYTTQMIEVAEQFADLLLILDHGRLHALTSVPELRAIAPGDHVLERLFADLHAAARP